MISGFFYCIRSYLYYSLINNLIIIQDVKECCFGMVLLPGYKDKIDRFRQAYCQLEYPASPKVHILTNHVGQFLDSVQEEYPGRDLGYFSEQV